MEARATSAEVKLILQQTAEKVGNIKRSYLVIVFGDAQVPNAIAGNQLRENLRKWQSPPDPSTNYNVARKMEHKGTEVWFFEDDKFQEWKVTGSLLWIYGKRKFIYLHDVGDPITYSFSSGLREERTVVRSSSALTVFEIL
jgi:hypothetical protein